MWYLFALLSACFSSVRKAGEKQLSHKLGFMTMGWVIQLFSLPVITVALILFGRFYNPLDLGIRFWFPTILMSSVAYPCFLFFYTNALKHGELSRVLPLWSLTPIFSLLLGRIFLSQSPSAVASIGILLVVTGVYVLNLKGRYLHSPFKIFTTDKPNLYTLVSLMISACIGLLDKIAIQESEPMFYGFVSTIIIIVTLFVVTKLKGTSQLAEAKKCIRPLCVSGVLAGFSYTLYVLALSTGPLAYVSTLKSTSVLAGAMIGIVYLNERLTKVKIASLILITLGSIVVGIGR